MENVKVAKRPLDIEKEGGIVVWDTECKVGIAIAERCPKCRDTDISADCYCPFCKGRRYLLTEEGEKLGKFHRLFGKLV